MPHTRKRLANALAACGRGQDADWHYAQYLAQDPDRQAIADGAEHLAAGRKPEAVAAFEGVLRRNPDHIDALRMLALALAGDAATVDDAEALLCRVTTLAPDYTAAWINLGALYVDQKKSVKAVDSFRTATRLAPANPAAWLGLANALAQATYPEESVAAYRRALELNPGNAHAQLSLAHELKAIGQQDAAIAAYRAAIRLRPDLGEAYWSLANLKTFRFSPDEVAAMRGQVDLDTLTPSTAAHFCFALGKAYEDNADYDSAWQWYHTGNQRQRPLVSHDSLIMENRNTAIMTAFHAEFLRERAGQGFDAPDPIFIVGLHRSGSTLIEQILASHSQVEGTAELPYLGRISAAVGRYRPDKAVFPEATHDLRPRDWRAYGQQYIEDTRRHRQTGRPRFTDKMPSNFPLIGFLHLILPNARIINASRHPLDSLLGNYKQLYGGGPDYSYDMEELSDYYRQYHRLMQHWEAGAARQGAHGPLRRHGAGPGRSGAAHPRTLRPAVRGIVPAFLPQRTRREDRQLRAGAAADLHRGARHLAPLRQASRAVEDGARRHHRSAAGTRKKCRARSGMSPQSKGQTSNPWIALRMSRVRFTDSSISFAFRS